MKRLAHFIVFLSAFWAVGALRAEDPASKLRDTVDAALGALYGPDSESMGPEAKRAKVREVIERNYDLTVIIRRAMGRNWDRLDAGQRDRVVELIKQLVVKAYVDGMNGKARPEVDFGETVRVTDNRAEVPSTVKTGEQTFNVLYRLGRMESGWQLFDIVAEDISVVSNYRQQFDDHFRKEDGAALISKLEELLKKEKLDEEVRL